MRTKKSIILAMAMAVAVCMGAVSCSKDDPKDDPKKEDPIEVADVFFSAENGDYCYYIGASGTPEAKLTVIRSNSTIAAEYAIKVVSADKGVTIPESVKFAEGQTSTTLTITAPAGSAAGTVLSFEIMFTGENVNPSANSTEGTLRCEGTFYFYKEIVSCATFVPYSSGDISDYMGNMKQVIWQLDATTFIAKNFLGTEHDLRIIIDAATKDIKTIVYDGFDLYTEIDSDGGTMYYFWDDPNQVWEEFSPKGDRRIISSLILYADAGYSAYVEGSTPYIYFSVPSVTFYSETDNIDKEFQWQYLCFYFYSEETMSTLDFTGFPEVSASIYPDPVYSETEKDGMVPIQVYLENEGIDLDTQYGNATDTGFEIPNFMYSDCSLKIILKDTYADFEMYDKDGNLVTAPIEGSSYLSLGAEYIYPWANNWNWCIYGIQAYNDPGYRLYYPDSKMIQFWGGYTIYNGDTASYMATQAGWIDIYW